LVLVTHDHSDHFDTTAITQSISTNAVIGVPLTVYNKLTTGLRSIAFVLTNGMATNLAGIRVEVIPAYNTNSSPFHARGSGNGYVLGIGNRRIYVSGDTHNIPEMSALQAIDIAFLAMNQPYTMTVTMAVSAVRAFRPRVVYPYHYRAASGYPATDLAGFKQQLLLDPGVEVRLRQWY
ncbi:MAG: MBL fold metallo-hydrolase, partial [Verrucomicrobiae bacterium]|nr:MBL fold metallo-hydrolase [Verrucomicrobiae bacterium]